ncbi:MAG: hypothetical protein ACJ76I_04485 [Gaiellaceae bacterium]
MTHSRNKLAFAAIAVVACVAAGAAFAATKLNGAGATTAPALAAGKLIASSNGGHRFDGSRPGHGRGGDELAAAGTYLGITPADLLTQLQSGKTLAQIANATSGKSAAGLIDALVAAEKTELDAAVTANQITKAQEDQIVPTLKARFTDLVNNTRPDHGPGPGGFGHGHGGDDLAAAATYLGVAPDALVTQLQAGKTLAQVADATNGKSTAGLVDALVAHETTEVDGALSAGRITKAQRDQIVAGLKERFTAFVNGTRASGAGVPPFGHGSHDSAPHNDRRI